MKFLVIHTDTTGDLDLAEVEATTAAEAITEVEGYDDTLQVEFAIEITGDVAPKVFAENGEEVTPTEGDALDEAADDDGNVGDRGLEHVD